MRGALTMMALALIGCNAEGTMNLTGKDANVRDAGSADDGAVLVDVGVADASSPVDAGPADAALSDAGPADAGIGVECVVPADCERGLEPFALPTCPNSGWSCLAGSCTWDCERAGRTCTVEFGPAGGRCVSCTDDPNNLVCPNVACSTPEFSMAMIEQGGGCARLLSASILSCQGDFAWLDEFGLPERLCAVAPLPTGAIRAVLTCGFCQQQYIW